MSLGKNFKVLEKVQKNKDLFGDAAEKGQFFV